MVAFHRHYLMEKRSALVILFNLILVSLHLIIHILEVLRSGKKTTCLRGHSLLVLKHFPHEPLLIKDHLFLSKSTLMIRFVLIEIRGRGRSR